MRNGFTLIELLIVITIIGILAVVVVPTVFNAPAKARDTARKADVLSIVKSIELGRADGVSLPATGCAGDVLNNFKKYMPNGVIPKDPKTDNLGFDDCDSGVASGEYMFQYYGTATVKYGVYARVERNIGNVECGNFSGDPFPLTETDSTCWGVISR